MITILLALDLQLIEITVAAGYLPLLKTFFNSDAFLTFSHVKFFYVHEKHQIGRVGIDILTYCHQLLISVFCLNEQQGENLLNSCVKSLD